MSTGLYNDVSTTTDPNTLSYGVRPLSNDMKNTKSGQNSDVSALKEALNRHL